MDFISLGVWLQAALVITGMLVPTNTRPQVRGRWAQATGCGPGSGGTEEAGNREPSEVLRPGPVEVNRARSSYDPEAGRSMEPPQD